MFKIYVVLIFCLSLAIGCKKDESRLVAQDGTAPVLDLSGNEFVLEKSQATDSVLAVSWTAADFGFAGMISYALQFDHKGGDFSQSQTISMPLSGRKLTVGELNNIAMGLGLPIGTGTEVQVRVRARLSTDFPDAFSDKSFLSLTPYLDLIKYDMVYVPGSYQNWSPGDAPSLADIGSDKKYQGFVYLSTAATSFKITTAPNWDVNYGGTSADNAGALILGGGDNMNIQGAGYYFFQIDLTGLTWKAEKTTWSMLGSATNTGDADLVFDDVTNLWKAEISLIAGEFKFRANHADLITFGDNKPGDPFLNAGGAPIKVEAAGNYLVELDLTHPGNYSYSLKKLN